jgi:ParB family transcriptional regulator, chromosome partitioning protein
VKKGLSVRETEALVRRLNNPQSHRAGENGAEGIGRDPNVARLESELAEKLGAQVQIQHTRTGRGKLVIAYHSLDELDGILAHIQ